ncbi:MAG TPA: molybdate ABC transporter permease subunit [Treponema sp.]|nr:MAG: molybdenum ABC transporter permease subunit [Treponema sp. GWC1_61_84]HCM29071.1 molybdate ABC transporter permease subunit [Treponema sp.]
MVEAAPLLVSARLAAAVTAILLVVCPPLVRIRLSTNSPWAALAESITVLPMVLPPTVVGFYFLAGLSPTAPAGRFLDERFGLRLLFSFPGLVLAGCVVCFPFMYQSLKTAMLSLDPRLLETSYTLGKGRTETFFRVILPNILPGILGGTILTFAHAIGEFGVVLMVGGAIGGETKTASIALFEAVESFDYPSAHAYAAVLLATSLAGVALMNLLQRDGRRLP